MAERRRREQEQAERQARIEEERRRLEAGRQAEIVAERKRREQEQAERGSREVNIGINARTVTPREMGERRLISNCNLVEVTSVDPGSPAARAGIRPGMIIRSFGGRVPHEPSDIPDRGKTGDTFNVDVIGQSPLIIQIMDHD
jgi:predicted metalloprotease with PDZ domain